MIHLRILIVSIVAVTFAAAARADDMPLPKSLLGVNVAWLTYYSPMCSTIDAIKSSQRFGSPRNPGDGRCPLDENGWPKADFGVVIAADVAGLTGTYKLSCEGKASISGIWGRTAVRNLKFDGKTTTADVEYRGGGAFALTFNGTNGGVRNLKLLRPGYTSDEGVFTKEYLASKEPFGAVRLMDWGRTNDSTVSRWEERCKLTDAQWSIKGGPWEPWLDFAAKTHKDLWICIPHMADDDYVENLALLCKKRLGDAPVNIYLEDSNEYWNRQFKQYQWIGEQARSHADEWKLNDPRGAYDVRHRYHARRTIEIGRIFRDVFGAGGGKRIRPVLTGQVAGYPNTEDAVKWVEANYGPLKDHVYGIACAPYFGNYGPATSPTANADELADHLLAAAKKYSTPASPTAAATGKFHALAKSKGVQSLAYEGGADLGGPPGKMAKELAQRYVAVRAEAQTRPSTGQAVGEYLEWWFNSGGDEFFYFNDFSPYARSGYWGLSNYPGKIDTPKYKAAIDVARKHPADAAAK